MEELFTVKKIKKFFDILAKLERQSLERYKGYGRKESNYGACAQEVFVNRTLNNWFSGRYLIFLDEENGVEFKRYIYVYSIIFGLGYSDDLKIYFIDYTKPTNIQSKKMGHNECLYLEGEWKPDDEQHKKLLDLINIDSEEKEYTYTGYDFSKYKSRGRKTLQQKEKDIETEIKVKARTRKESFKKLKELEKENPQLMIKY